MAETDEGGEGEEKPGTAGDPLGTLLGTDCSRFTQAVGRSGVIRFRGREGSREVSGEYHPATFRLAYSGWDEGGRQGLCADQLRGDRHADFKAALLGLHSWLDSTR